MFSLFRENVRIALDSIKTQLLRTILTIVIMGIGIWSLVGILSAVKALETNIAGNFASMGSNTFNIERYEFSVNREGRGERKKINPIIRYDDVRNFIDIYEYPFTSTSVSFAGCDNISRKAPGGSIWYGFLNSIILVLTLFLFLYLVNLA